MPSSTPSLGLRLVTERKTVVAVQFTLVLADPESAGSEASALAASAASASVNRNCSFTDAAALALRRALLTAVLVPSSAAAAPTSGAALAGRSAPAPPALVVDLVLVSACYFHDAPSASGALSAFTVSSRINTLGNSFASLDALIGSTLSLGGNSTTRSYRRALVAQAAALGASAAGGGGGARRQLKMDLPLPAPLPANTTQQQLTFTLLAPSAAAASSMASLLLAAGSGAAGPPAPATLRGLLGSAGAGSAALSTIVASMSNATGLNFTATVEGVAVVSLTFESTFYQLFWDFILRNIINVCAGASALIAVVLVLTCFNRLKHARRQRALAAKQGRLDAQLGGLKQANLVYAHRVVAERAATRWVRIRAAFLRALKDAILRRAKLARHALDTVSVDGCGEGSGAALALSCRPAPLYSLLRIAEFSAKDSEAEAEAAAARARLEEEAAALAAAEAARAEAARVQRQRMEAEAAAAAANAARVQDVAAVLQDLLSAVEAQVAAEEAEEVRLKALMREHLMVAGFVVGDLREALRCHESNLSSAAAAQALGRACEGVVQQCRSGGTGACSALLYSGALATLLALLRSLRSLGASRLEALSLPIAEHAAALRSAALEAEAKESMWEALEMQRVVKAKSYPGRAAQDAVRRQQLDAGREASRLEELLAAAKLALATAQGGMRTGPCRVLEAALGALAAMLAAAGPAQARAAAVEVLPTVRKLKAEWKDFEVAWPLTDLGSQGAQKGIVAALAALAAT